MGKGHRDNHKARLKRGSVAFTKKAMRRAIDTNKIKCSACGNEVRVKTLTPLPGGNGICQRCAKRMGLISEEEGKDNAQAGHTCRSS